MERKLCGEGWALPAAPQGEEPWKKRLRRYACNLVTWMGIVAVGLLALPVGLVILLICAAWSLGDWIAARIRRKGGD